ncbi:predicted protein [Enterococcus faecium 1,141,733]|nr:predicted protein [Enterococcus faecium 1,141,733]
MPQIIRTAKQKQLLLFFVWLDLLPQMQSFEHRLSRGRKPAVQLRVTRNNFKKQFLMFVEYRDL